MSDDPKPKDRRIRRFLSVYEKHSDVPQGEIDLSGVSLGELQRIFRRPKDDQMYEVHPVGKIEASALSSNANIDLERYDYFLEAESAD